MKLPASLAPWAKHLQIFPEEISLALGEYVRKLAPFFSPLNAANDDADGEPNGYDGVARRGIYERLLLSELALADEFGEEFVRRAVMGEHLFLHLAKILPGAKRVSVALFDAGAAQLGAPRIAHLAALVVLARRAEAGDAAFLWGVLQEDARELVFSDDTEASVKLLLESRTAREADEASFKSWREKLREIDKTADVWLVGGENLAQLAGAKAFSHLYVEEPVEIEKRELLIKIKSASGVERQTRLPLPPPGVCTRLVRNPFERAPKIDVSTAKLDGAVTNFFFDSTGSKLFAKLDSYDILSFSIQNVRNPQRIYPTVYKSFDPQTFVPVRYIAVGRLRKAIAVAVKVDDQTIRLEYRKPGFNLKKGLYRTAAGEAFVFPDNEKGLLRIFNVRPQGFHYDEAAILDAAGNLFLLNQIGQEDAAGGEPLAGTATPLARDVLAVAESDHQFVYVGCEDGNDYHRLVSTSDKVERRALAGRKLRKAFFGRGEYGRKVIGFEDELGTWTIMDEQFNHRLMPLPKGEVVGVYHDSRLAPVAGFFELMDDRRTLEFCWQYGRRKQIFRAEEEIVKIEFSPRSPVVAYQTAAGALVLFSLTHRAVIGRYSK